VRAATGAPSLEAAFIQTIREAEAQRGFE
jgi:hypothetical protein